MMADDQALQGPPIHLAPGSRGRAQIIAPYQSHGFTKIKVAERTHDSTLSNNVTQVVRSSNLSNFQIYGHPPHWCFRMIVTHLPISEDFCLFCRLGLRNAVGPQIPDPEMTLTFR